MYMEESMQRKIIERRHYLNRLISYKGIQIIKIITGVRRCGKSTLLQLYMDYLRSLNVRDERIISINFEDYDNRALCRPEALHTYVTERLADGQWTYVLLDEVQLVPDFQRVVDSLFIKPYVDLYVTGSNASLLGGELATLLAGRYIEIHMLPLSFSEYVEATGQQKSTDSAYREYLTTSSFPYVLTYDVTATQRKDYLDAILNTIIVKDVASHLGTADVMMIKRIVRFICDTIGSPLSTKKIADTMSSDGQKVDWKTVERYLNALQESFIIYQAKRYNIRGRQHLRTLEKYYIVDLAFRSMLIGSRTTDVDRMLENVVYLELIRRGFDVFVGKIDSLAVDFIAFSHGEIAYYQVAESVRDSATLARELAPFAKISDHWPKYLLTRDEEPDAYYDGVRKRNALSWLMDGSLPRA